MNADSTATRLARLDEAIARRRDMYLKACWDSRDADAIDHQREVDRLLKLRFRVQRRAVMAVPLP